MSTDRFDYGRLPGVVSREQAETALQFVPSAEAAEAGLVLAVCPVCEGELHCRTLPGSLVDLWCHTGCPIAEVVAAVKAPRQEVAR